MKRTITILSFILLFSNVLYSQFGVQKNEHAFSRGVVFTAEGGVTYAFTDFKDPLFKLLGKGSIEYFFPSSSVGAFGLKFFGGLGAISGEGNFTGSNNPQSFESDIIFIGGGLVYALELNEVIHPYICIGASYLFAEPHIPSTFPDQTIVAAEKEFSDINYNGEMGLRFFLSDYFSLNIEGMVHINPNDNIDGLIPRGDANDLFYSITTGFSLYYLARDNDTDQDGIIDTKDLCPDSPIGVVVDEFGCPKDTDSDGVPDYIDECEQTPSNVVVDNNGCPIDTDKDGVPDYIDQCANTPSEAAVDASGCPLDLDKDGIPDYKDKCLDTPLGIEVDESGCKKIELKKEIPKEVTTLVLSGKANFATGKSDLLPFAKAELDKLIKVMKEYPDTRWRIEGHTDNTGSYAGNKKISLKRADAVLDYFMRNGLNAERYEVYGLGPDFPIADNSTESGRAQNRRVAVKFIEEKEAKKPQEKVPALEENIIYNITNERNVESTIFSDGKLFCIQVSSWRTDSKAQKEVVKLLEQGRPAYVLKVYIPSKGATWYRVRIGYFNTLEEARAYLKSF